MTKIINLFGGPGSGKSTAASNVYVYLKSKNIKCEIVKEFATEIVWNKRFEDFKDQLYILGEQNHRQQLLLDQVDFIIAESPLPLITIHRKFYEMAFLNNTCFDNLVLEVFNKYNNINFYLERKFDYDSIGRYQKEDEAKKLDAKIKLYLNENNIAYFITDGAIIIDAIDNKIDF